MITEKQEMLKRLKSTEGHLGGIRSMIEDDTCCMDILHQTYAVRKAIEKLESLLVASHLQTCVPEGLADGKIDQVITELVQLYDLAGNRCFSKEKDDSTLANLSSIASNLNEPVKESLR